MRECGGSRVRCGVGMGRLRFSDLGAIVALMASAAIAPAVSAGEVDPAWQLADRRGKGDASLALFVEADPTPGRPSFRLETSFDVPPSLAHQILSESMLNPNEAPAGQVRKILERTDKGTIVYTFIDLPMMLSDRELAIRVVESLDPATGVHRIEWAEANDLLPPADADVVRLTGAAGFWEFRPNGHGGTQAIHTTRTELGGSIPQSIGDRLMKSQAIDSVESLRERIARYTASDVSAGPP
jgi:hypothetical protein